MARGGGRQQRPVLQSLNAKSILFLVGAFLVVGAGTLWGFGLIGDHIAVRVGRLIAERHVLWHKERIQGAVERELALAQQMADSQVLKRWSRAEDDPETAAHALEEIRAYHKAFRARTVFLALAGSRHFFYADATTDQVQLSFSDTLLPDDEDDRWFFATLADATAYNLNIDHNASLGVNNLWVNQVMRGQDGEPLGVVGLTELITDFITQSSRGVTTMMVDEGGALQAHMDPTRIAQNVLGRHEPNSSGIWEMLDSDADREALRQAMEAVRSGSRESGTLLATLDGKPSLVGVAYLAPLKWFSLAVFESSSMIGFQERGALAAVFVGGLLITAVAFVLGQNLLIVRPLLRLTEGARRLSDGDYTVRLETKQRDEIGDLTLSFNHMATTIERPTRDLERGRIAAMSLAEDAEAARAEVSAYKDQLEELVEERTKRLQSIIDTAVDGIIVIDDAGVIQSFSPAATAIFGYEQEEAVGQNVSILSPHGAEGKHVGALDAYKAGGASSVVGSTRPVIGRRKDGAAFPMDLAVGEAWLNNERFFTGIARDITERKAAEDKLADAYDVIAGSIDYASRIQRSLLPDTELLDTLAPQHFVIWEPRDTVGGDAYWCARWGRGAMVALGDCTGHGVPGAFMTMIANGAMEMALLESPPGDPATLLQRIHQLIQTVLGQNRDGGESNDGLLDQVGGPRRRGFGKKRFSALLSEIADRPWDDQRDAILSAMAAYQGDEARRDDVSVLGFAVGAAEKPILAGA